MGIKKTIIDGEEYQEELSFKALSEWSAGRWMAGQPDCSNDIMKRAAALVKAENPANTCIRDEANGELKVVNDAASEESKALAKMQEEDDFEKSFKEKNPNATKSAIEAALASRKK